MTKVAARAINSTNLKKSSQEPVDRFQRKKKKKKKMRHDSAGKNQQRESVPIGLFLKSYGHMNSEIVTHSAVISDNRLALHIRKTCPCNVFPLKPHFYLEKTGGLQGYS